MTAEREGKANKEGKANSYANSGRLFEYLTCFYARLGSVSANSIIGISGSLYTYTTEIQSLIQQ